MRVGKYRHRIEVQVPVEEQKLSGGVATRYEPYVELWASIEPLVGREQYDSQQVQASFDTRIRIRYNRVLNEKMRVKHVVEHGSPTVAEFYDIVSVNHPFENRRETVLLCTTRRTQGFRQDGTDV